MVTNMVLVTSEITIEGTLNYKTKVRGVVKNIRFDSSINVLSRVDDECDCEVWLLRSDSKTVFACE